MHSKLFLSLALLAVASAAALYDQKHITVDTDGSFCQIVSENGNQLKLIKNKHVGSHGLKTFDVILQGPAIYTTFHIDNQIGGDVLADLCARYQGPVDDSTFQKILYKIEEYVQQGDLHPKVFYMFKCLHDTEALKYLTNDDVYGDDYYFRLYGKTFQGPYTGYYGKKFYEHGEQYYPHSFDNYGKTLQGPFTGYYGKKFYEHGEQYYPHSFDNEDDCQDCWSIGDIKEFAGKYSPWEDNMYFRKHMPYGERYYGMNKYGLKNLMESETDREVEDLEQEETAGQFGNRMIAEHYGNDYPRFQHQMTKQYEQRYPFQYYENTHHNQWEAPRPDLWEMNQFDHHGHHHHHHHHHHHDGEYFENF